MRRLLFFGTGAAIIGILFLIIAFYESYLIVSTLQRQLVQVVIDTNRLLEDAALEAVFLGIMAAVGYALVSKGLDGIRREELLQAEGMAEVTFGRGQSLSRQDKPRYVARSLSAKAPHPVKREQVSGLHPGIKQQATQPNRAGQRTNMQTPPTGMQAADIRGKKPTVASSPLASESDISETQTNRTELVDSQPEEASGESTDAATSEDRQVPAEAGT